MTESATFQMEADRDRAVLTLLPKLNQIAWADIEHVGSQMISRIGGMSNPKVLVDLTSLEYMGSAQLALVVRLFKLIKEKNGAMVVANRHPMVLEVLTLAGLNKIWTIVDSREAAQKLLGGAPASPSDRESDDSPLAAYLGIGLVALALLALGAGLSGSPRIPAATAFWGAIGTAAGAFLCGLIAVFTSQGGGRNLGAIVLVVGLGLGLAGGFLQTQAPAKPAEPAPGKTEHAATALSPPSAEPQPAVASGTTVDDSAPAAESPPAND